ncbi:MAG: hypothetical protein H6740_19665 [Alphaproteobacteria bacterium]|nr:hypothetical protein [Alphaproteobacteria bacterium]
MLATTLMTALLLTPQAQAQDDEDMNAGYYAGVRGGVSVPINGRGLAWPVSIEAGLEFPSHVTLGMRLSFQYDPPEIFGIETPAWGVGPLIDLRYNYKANKAVELYPMGGLGFLFGVSDAGDNVVLPLISLGVGTRIKPGGGAFYVSPEIGVTNFTVPYMGIGLGISKPPPKVD